MNTILQPTKVTLFFETHNSKKQRKYKRIPEGVAEAAHTAVRALAIPPYMLERLQELPTQYSYMTPEDKCSIFDLVVIQ